MGTGNLKGINLPQGVSQQIISQYVDDTSFLVKAEKKPRINRLPCKNPTQVWYNLWTWNQLAKSVAYWCGQGWVPRWVGIYQWKWAANGDLSKLLGTPFGLKLELQDIDQLFIVRVKGKPKY